MSVRDNWRGWFRLRITGMSKLKPTAGSVALSLADAEASRFAEAALLPARAERPVGDVETKTFEEVGSARERPIDQGRDKLGDDRLQTKRYS